MSNVSYNVFEATDVFGNDWFITELDDELFTKFNVKEFATWAGENGIMWRVWSLTPTQLGFENKEDVLVFKLKYNV